jgi:hypothetical protein
MSRRPEPLPSVLDGSRLNPAALPFCLAEHMRATSGPFQFGPAAAPQDNRWVAFARYCMLWRGLEHEQNWQPAQLTATALTWAAMAMPCCIPAGPAAANWARCGATTRRKSRHGFSKRKHEPYIRFHPAFPSLVSVWTHQWMTIESLSCGDRAPANACTHALLRPYLPPSWPEAQMRWL